MLVIGRMDGYEKILSIGMDLTWVRAEGKTPAYTILRRQKRSCKL